MADPSLIERLRLGVLWLPPYDPPRTNAMVANVRDAEAKMTKASSTLEDQARLIGECREGFEPFAQPSGWADDLRDGQEIVVRVRAGDIRNARALLTKLNASTRSSTTSDLGGEEAR